MSEDGRPLHVRVKALANRFDAMASGAEKQAALSLQVAQNHRRDAQTLHDAVAALLNPREALKAQVRETLTANGDLGGTCHTPKP